MKTIIKAILKFFKFSKLTFIGLFVLIFFSLSIYTVLNSTSLNLTNSYSTVSNQGNLHDFVINENYRYGNGSYLLDDGKSSTDPSGDVKISEIKSATSSSSSSNYDYQVTFKLEENLIAKDAKFEWTFAYKNAYEKYQSDPTKYEDFKDYVEYTSTITSTDADVNTSNWTTKSNFYSLATSIVSNKASSLNTYVENAYKDEFISDLETNAHVSIRDFESLNISNTKQNIFFKLVESSPQYAIDKLVLYQGENLSTATNFSAVDNVLNATEQELESDSSLSRGLLPFLYKAKWSSESVSFDDIYNYSINNTNYNPYTNKNGDTEVTDLETQSKLLKQIINTSNGIINDTYQVRFSYSNAGVAPVSGYVEDFTSYGAVISTNYLKTLNKTPINYIEWLSHLNDKQASFDAWLNSLSENTFEIDNQKFIILGAGVSPDFMYPIVSFANLVPNSNSEQVVYTNSSGYSKMVNSFRGNEQETFLVGTFSSKNKALNQNTLNQINEIAKNYMAWPSNISAAYMYNDTSNTISPTALRVIFIPQIVSTITNVSGFLTTFILLLSVVIAIVIIRRCIETNRNSLGIMQANGYKKREIIFGMCLLILFPVLTASILGYILGTSLQTIAINLLGSFWTLPTQVSSISFASMFLTLFVVSVLFLVLVIVFSSICLRGETSEFMKDDAKYKMSKIASVLKKPFSKFAILDRLRAAIAFSSVWRLLLLSLMSALLISSLTFSINILNSFKDSAEKTYAVRNYNYALNLLTPTLQSGQYYTVPYQQQGKTLDKTSYFDTSLATDTYDQSDSYISQGYWESGSYKRDAESNSEFKSNLQKFGNYQLMSQDDLTKQNSDIYYLKNKTTTKAFADINLGAGSISSNPWTLASQLMPTNNTSYANQAFYNMFSNAVADNTTPITIQGINEGKKTTLYDSIKTFVKAYAVLKTNKDSTTEPVVTNFGAGKPSITTMDEINNNSSLFYDSIDSEKDDNYSYYLEFTKSLIADSAIIATKVKVGFLNLLYELYSKTSLSDYTYSINYNKLVVDKTNTPFTYINFNIKSINKNEINNADSLNMTGLSNDFTNPDLYVVDNENYILNQTLWTSPTISHNGQTIYPIVVNQYAKRKYGLNIGDIITANILNSADRYSRSYYGVDNPVAYFKIIDISSTYQGSEFYINQYDANKILGLTINNVKPKAPTSKDEITSSVSWNNLEYDYGNNVTLSTDYFASASDLVKKDDFISDRSGFNGIFSTSNSDLKEVSGGVSLYSLSGIYPGTDLISSEDSTMTKLFSNKENMKSAIKQLGFLDLLDSSGEPNVTAKDLIQKIADIFGSSSSFFIVSNASSISSTLDVLNTSSMTLTKIQVAFLSILIIITVLIIVIVSSLIINDSFKLAAILKCLGLDDKKNAASFLSVYLPVFFLGLLISIPITFIMTSVYVTFIFNFAGILIVSNNAFWHFIVASLGIIVIFFLSYWTTWQKIGNMDLSKSIK